MAKNISSGGHFVILSGGTPWSMTNPVPAKPKTTRSGAKSRAAAKEGVPPTYPFFVTLSSYAEDPYWKDLLLEASRGSLPRGFRYYPGLLTYKGKARSHELHFNETKPEEAFRLIQQFLTDRGGLFSEEDVEAAKRTEETLHAASSVSEVDSWSKLRGPRVRTIAVSSYVERVGNSFGLSTSERSMLNSIINAGILAGFLNNDTIHVAEGRITSIDGLRREGTHFWIETDAIRPKIRRTRRIVDSDDESEKIFSMTSGSQNTTVPESTAGKPIILARWLRFTSDWAKR